MHDNNNFNNYKSSKELIACFNNTSSNTNLNLNEMFEFKSKCLNDLSYLNQKNLISNSKNSSIKPTKLTHVDVLVPSDSKRIISNRYLDTYYSGKRIEREIKIISNKIPAYI